MPSREYTVKATGENESRELRLSKQDDGTYQIVLWWGRGNRALATLHIDEAEFRRLDQITAGLLTK